MYAKRKHNTLEKERHMACCLSLIIVDEIDLEIRSAGVTPTFTDGDRISVRIEKREKGI